MQIKAQRVLASTLRDEEEVVCKVYKDQGDDLELCHIAANQWPVGALCGGLLYSSVVLVWGHFMYMNIIICCLV